MQHWLHRFQSDKLRQQRIRSNTEAITTTLTLDCTISIQDTTMQRQVGLLALTDTSQQVKGYLVTICFLIVITTL